MPKHVYVDYNATTPLSNAVLAVVQEALISAWGNPSSLSQEGKFARKVIDEARSNVAKCINSPPSDILFTSGGSESNNWVIHSSIKHFHKKSCDEHKIKASKPHVITSTVEHDSIAVPLSKLVDEGVIELTQVSINGDSGTVEPVEVAANVKPNTCLVTIMMANNETGTVMPIKEIMDLVQKKAKDFRSRIFRHTDAAQTIGKLPVNVDELNVDFLTVVGHKFYGPRIGALFVKDLHNYSGELTPLIYGGGQERGWRAGTENTPMIAGLGTAAKEICDHLNEYRNAMQSSRDYLEKRLIQVFGASNLHFNCKGINRLPNTCNVSFIGKGLEGYKIVECAKTFSCSTGSACHAGSCTPSKILTLFHIPDSIAANAVRISTGRGTTKKDIDIVVEELHHIIKDLSANLVQK